MQNTPLINVKLAPQFVFRQIPYTPPGGSLITPAPLNLGPIEDRSVKTDNKPETFYDDSNDGIARPIMMVEQAREESWELTTPNINGRIMSMFWRSNPPVAPSPSITGGSSTDVPHTLWPGTPVQIVDANGNRVYNITSITNVKVGGTTTLQVGTDYSFTKDSLLAGMIYITTTTTAVTAAMAGTISYVSGAITGEVVITPNSGPCSMSGYGEIILNSCGQKKLVRSGLATIMIPDLTLSTDKAARVKPTVTFMYDPTGVYTDKVMLLGGYATLT